MIWMRFGVNLTGISEVNSQIFSRELQYEFCFFTYFFNGFIFLFSETVFSFLESARSTHEVAVRFLFAFALRIFQTAVNDEN